MVTGGCTWLAGFGCAELPRTCRAHSLTRCVHSEQVVCASWLALAADVSSCSVAGTPGCSVADRVGALEPAISAWWMPFRLTVTFADELRLTVNWPVASV